MPSRKPKAEKEKCPNCWGPASKPTDKRYPFCSDVCEGEYIEMEEREWENEQRIARVEGRRY